PRTEPLSLHDALPIWKTREAEQPREQVVHLCRAHPDRPVLVQVRDPGEGPAIVEPREGVLGEKDSAGREEEGEGQVDSRLVSLKDRKSTRLNSSHDQI